MPVVERTFEVVAKKVGFSDEKVWNRDQNCRSSETSIAWNNKNSSEV